MEKTSFIFYKDWANVIKDLPAEVRLDVYDAVTEYALSGKHHDLKPMAKIAFGFIKQALDRDTSKYMDVSTKRKESGKIGAQKRWQNIAKDSKNSICYDNDNDNDNVNENDINSAHEGFSANPAITNSNLFRKPIIPKYEEVERVFIQQGGTIEMAKKFFAKYEATEWFYNNSPIMKFSTLVPGFMEIWRRNSNRQPEVTERKRFKL